LNAVDVGHRRCGIEVLTSKEEGEVATGLLRLWSRLGLPTAAQFDNGQTIAGHHRHLALPARACPHLGIRARFTPFGEPWRNGVVEHFIDIFDKRFFRTERFRDLAHLARRARSSRSSITLTTGTRPSTEPRRRNGSTGSGSSPPFWTPRHGSPPKCPGAGWWSLCGWSGPIGS
jgi:hypothetical protein